MFMQLFVQSMIMPKNQQKSIARPWNQGRRIYPGMATRFFTGAAGFSSAMRVYSERGHEKHVLAAALFACCLAFSHAQTDIPTRPRLGVLPFSGGPGGDGQTIADLLSSCPNVLRAFALVPIPPAAVPAVSEHRLQASAFADSDTLAEIGRIIGADYVLSGHLRRLGRRNLVIASVIHVESFELVAGYYRTYRSFWEARGFLPSMSRSLVEAALKRPAAGAPPTLAVAPWQITPEAQALGDDAPRVFDAAELHDLETLAQILAIRIARSGEYAVLPRASSMAAAMRAWEIRVADERAATLERLIQVIMGILDAPDEAAPEDLYGVAAVTSVGRAAGADFVLSLETRALDGVNVFAAQILRTEDGGLLAGAGGSYGRIGEGANLMAELAFALAEGDAAPELVAALERRRRRIGVFGDTARFWSLGAFAGTSFADPWAVGGLQATLAPLPFSFLRLGFELGFISEMEGADFHSMYPSAHAAFFLPFSWGGLHVGAGGGFMIASYAFHGVYYERRTALADFAAGVNIRNVFDVSYSLRTDFSTAGGRFSVGFTHRFRIR